MMLPPPLPFRGFRRCRDDSCEPAREIHPGLRYSDPVCAYTHAYVTRLDRLHTSHGSHACTASQHSHCQLELLLCTAVQEWWLHRARGPFLPGRALLPPVAVPAAPSHTISCLLHVTTKILSVAETRTTIAYGPCTLRPRPCAHQLTLTHRHNMYVYIYICVCVCVCLCVCIYIYIYPLYTYICPLHDLIMNLGSERCKATTHLEDLGE